MPVILGYLLVFVGGGLGAAARHFVNRTALALAGPDVPWGTLTVNIAGCFVMGLLGGWFALRGEAAPQPLRLFLTTGILGGFTTFSAFSLDAAVLWQRGAIGTAAGYVLASLGLSLAGVFAGLAVIRALLSAATPNV